MQFDADRNGSQGSDRTGAAPHVAPRHREASQETGAPSGAPAYHVKPGAHVRAADAAPLAEVMRKLVAEGRSTAADLLREAAPEESPIHHCFEWDDAEAARKHRLGQAAYYWRTIEIVVNQTDSTEKKLRAFHPVFVDGARQYQDIGTIAQSESLMSQLLDQAKRDMIAFKHRYAMLREASQLGPVFEAIDNLIKKVA